MTEVDFFNTYLTVWLADCGEVASMMARGGAQAGEETSVVSRHSFRRGTSPRDGPQGQAEVHVCFQRGHALRPRRACSEAVGGVFKHWITTLKSDMWAVCTQLCYF